MTASRGAWASKFLRREERLFLEPGQIFLTQEPWEVYTTVDSRVSATLLHRESGLSAICHAALPFPLSPTPTAEESRQRYRYVMHAFPRIIQPYLDRGIAPSQIEARLFGGSSLAATHPHQREVFRVGKGNAIEARNQLKQHGIPIRQEDVGACQTRRILFHAGTGHFSRVDANPSQSKRPELLPRNMPQP